MNVRCLPALGVVIVLTASNAWGQGGPPGGRIFNLFVDPTTQGMVYAATSRGIFRSDNGGLSWGPASAGLTSPDTSWIAGGGGRLYTATLGGGVFGSDDGGDNWTPASAGLTTLDVVSLGVDPTNPLVVYVGTRNRGIAKTTDGGDSWVAVNNGLVEFDNNGTIVFEGDYNQIVVDPNNPETIYAVHSSNAVQGSGVFFRSTNGGQQWRGASSSSGLSLAIDPTDSNNLYIGTSSGAFRTADGGDTIEVLPGLRGVSVNALAIDPADPMTLYAATGRFFAFRTTDGGDTWQQIPIGLAQGTMLTVAVDPHQPSNLYAGTNGGGVFHTMDRGDNWHLRSDGIPTSDVRALAVDPVDAANVIAGVFGGGAFRSTDGAGRWQEARTGIAAVQLRDIAFAPSDPNTVSAGSVNPLVTGDGTLFKSTNGGMDWTATVTGISILSVVVDPVDSQIVYLGTSSGAFRSVDGGSTFLPINDIRGDVPGALAGWTVLDVEMDPTNRDTLYATALLVDFFFGQQVSQVFRTVNAGLDWDGTGSTQVFTLFDLEIDPFDSNRLIVGSNGGLFRKIGTDGGFDPINVGLPNGGAVAAPAIAFDPNETGTVYAATNSGIFKSTNAGNSWTEANAGLQNLAANVLVADSVKAGVLYAGTSSGGVFKTENGGAQWTPTRSFVTTDPVLTLAGIVGAPDFQGGGVSAGEIITFFALNVGPVVGVQADFDPKTGKLPTELAGVRVFFDDVLAAIFFVRDGQINCQVPYEMAGLDIAEVRVEVNGVSSNVVTLRILDSHPGVFNAVLNQDLSLNTETNTGAAGNFIVLFVTGQGLVDPALMSGQPAPLEEPLPSPVLPFSVTIGDREAVGVAVLAPGFVGLLQINVLLSVDLPPGTYEVFVEIGGRRSHVGVLVFVG